MFKHIKAATDHPKSNAFISVACRVSLLLEATGHAMLKPLVAEEPAKGKKKRRHPLGAKLNLRRCSGIYVRCRGSRQQATKI